MTQTLCRPFSSVLVANRGEIALRIAREATALAVTPIVAVSDADAADWADLPFRTVRIGAAAPSASYLNIDSILAAAHKIGAEAVHPGYGFLSENDVFADAVIAAGLVWIGPSPAAIRAMADKGMAKAIARDAGVPVIDGYDGGDQSEALLAREAERIGFPVLLKASMGGGGRGQRLVTRSEDFAAALASARREALSAFGSERMILERMLANARHIEMQVLGDVQGHIIHLGERDCSVQRRNQKIIEEAPASGLAPETRAAMGAAAVRLARAVGYVNAGTVEFLVDAAGKFFFLEMNTRIQVEHPVTEAICGLNLIALQFSIAMGKPLGFAQDDLHFSGHAIEARLCAEDPADNYRPQIGALWLSNFSPMVRVDAGPGLAVSGHYDSMLAKVISVGETREAARAKLRAALGQSVIAGLATNRAQLCSILDDEEFARGGVDIGWLTRRGGMSGELSDSMWRAAAIGFAGAGGIGWSSSRGRNIIVLIEHRGTRRRFSFGEDDLGIAIERRRQVTPVLTQLDIVAGVGTGPVSVYVHGNVAHVISGAQDGLFIDITYRAAATKDGASDGMVRAPMAGRITSVAVIAGAAIVKGSVIATLESMKMEHEIRAAADGRIDAVQVKAGDQVSSRQVIAVLAPSAAAKD